MAVTPGTKERRVIVGATAAASGADTNNWVNRGIMIIVNITAFTSGSITPQLQLKDPSTGNYINLLGTVTALIATGSVVYMVYPGIPNTKATGSAITQQDSIPLPKTYRINVTGSSPVLTYSVTTVELP